MNELLTQTEKALNSLFDAINMMGGDKDVMEGVANVLNKQHRTLQQNFMRLIIVPSIKSFADKKSEGRYDLRNEASCELAEKLLPIVKESPLQFI